MNLKWYIGALAALISLLVLDLQQDEVHNQQIQLQLGADAFSEEKAGLALSDVTKGLSALGIDQVKVIDLGNQEWQITYYSPLSAKGIQQQLVQKVLASVENAALTSTDLQQDLGLSISVIDSEPQSDLGFDGRSIVEAKQELQRATDLRWDAGTFRSLQVIELLSARSLKTKLGDSEISLHRTLLEIPETRAGPDLV